MRPIETRYARRGDVRIAFQVVGQRSFDLVFVPGFISNLDLHCLAVARRSHGDGRRRAPLVDEADRRAGLDE
ncbi:hypothetical protein [Mesorhizobium sp. LjRoot246]|uniref:hypothetical protein n=1 Tax=Mesorhizobium sp. LjRoot246 TaxID=3342294 RepID=UPI003ECE6A01